MLSGPGPWILDLKLRHSGSRVLRYIKATVTFLED